MSQVSVPARAVREQFGVELHEEIVYLGDFD